MSADGDLTTAQLAEALGLPLGARCPQCRAEPGQPCRRPNGSKFLTVWGGPRFHVKRGAGPSA